MNTTITARQSLEIKGSLIFLSGFITISLLASLFQFLAGQGMATILPPAFVNAIIVTLAFIIYRRKRNGRAAAVLSWFVSILALTVILIARFMYSANFDWA